MGSLTDYKKPAIFLLAGVILGIAWLILIRTVLAINTAPHYHANFAVFVDDQRLKFEGPTFYEEITACDDSNSSNPKSRVHMHDNVDYVVHVHDEGATWGHFFANLRYGLSDSSLTLDDKVLADGQDGKKLSFMLNGVPISSIANKAITSEDALLISYGSQDEQALKAQYEQIKRDAKDYNQRQDPASCSGSESLDLSQKFKKALQVN